MKFLLLFIFFVLPTFAEVGVEIKIEDGGKEAIYNLPPQVISFDFSNAIIDLPRLKDGGMLPDGMPTLNYPKAILPKDMVYLKPDDYVIGVEVNGALRAYPLRLLNWHGGINDELGGKKIFIGWDPLSGTALAIDRVMGGLELEFGVSGMVYQSTSLYYDRQTQSMWSPLMMQAVSGRFSGQNMKMIPVFMTYWHEFHQIFPQATVTSFENDYVRDYTKSPLGNYGREKGLLFPTMYYSDALPRKEPIMGVILKQENKEIAVAFAINSLLEAKKARYEFRFGSERIPIAMELEKPTGRIQLWAPEGVEVKGMYSYWFTWSAHYPKTLVVKELP